MHLFILFCYLNDTENSGIYSEIACNKAWTFAYLYNLIRMIIFITHNHDISNTDNLNMQYLCFLHTFIFFFIFFTIGCTNDVCYEGDVLYPVLWWGKYILCMLKFKACNNFLFSTIHFYMVYIINDKLDFNSLKSHWIVSSGLLIIH